jgi:hypothetical protein
MVSRSSPPLADVDRDGDDLGTGTFGDPADGDGGVQPSGVGHGRRARSRVLLQCRDLLYPNTPVGGEDGAGRPARPRPRTGTDRRLPHGGRALTGTVSPVGVGGGHRPPSPAARSRKRAATWAPPPGSRVTTNTLSSPAMVPITSAMVDRSMAEARNWAAPGGVRRMTRFAEASAVTSCFSQESGQPGVDHLGAEPGPGSPVPAPVVGNRVDESPVGPPDLGRPEFDQIPGEGCLGDDDPSSVSRSRQARSGTGPAAAQDLHDPSVSGGLGGRGPGAARCPGTGGFGADPGFRPVGPGSRLLQQP